MTTILTVGWESFKGIFGRSRILKARLTPAVANLGKPKLRHYSASARPPADGCAERGLESTKRRSARPAGQLVYNLFQGRLAALFCEQFRCRRIDWHQGPSKDARWLR